MSGFDGRANLQHCGLMNIVLSSTISLSCLTIRHNFLTAAGDPPRANPYFDTDDVISPGSAKFTSGAKARRERRRVLRSKDSARASQALLQLPFRGSAQNSQ